MGLQRKKNKLLRRCKYTTLFYGNISVNVHEGQNLRCGGVCQPQGKAALPTARAPETQKFLDPPSPAAMEGPGTSATSTTLHAHLSRVSLSLKWSISCPNATQTNPNPCLLFHYFNITLGRARSVFTEHETSPKEQHWAWAGPWSGLRPERLPGHGQSSIFDQKRQTQVGFDQTESGAGLLFHIVFCIKKYISEICYRQGQDYRVHNVNRLLLDFIFVKLL